MFLKVPVIIIVRFGENNVFGGVAGRGMGGTLFTLHLSFTINKNGKILEHDLS